MWFGSLPSFTYQVTRLKKWHSRYTLGMVAGGGFFLLTLRLVVTPCSENLNTFGISESIEKATSSLVRSLMFLNIKVLKALARHDSTTVRYMLLYYGCRGRANFIYEDGSVIFSLALCTWDSMRTKSFKINHNGNALLPS